LTAGNYLYSGGHALTGPSVRGRGGSVRRLSGRLVTELLLAQPNVIGGTAEGHLVRGRVGVRTSRATAAFNISDFERPAGGYTTLPAVQQTLVDADEEERMAIERRLTDAAPSNRVRGAGIDAEFRPSRSHTLTMRGGVLWLENTAGARGRAPAGEASYAYSSRPASLNLRWRATPPTLRGIALPSDELTADGAVSLAGNLRLVGRAYRTASDTADVDLSSSGEGGALGVRFTRGARRVEVRANYRESEFGSRNVRQTVSALLATPVGPLTLSVNADVGQQVGSLARTDVAFYRGDLRWLRHGRTVSFSATHSQGVGPRRQRADFIASLAIRSVELAGGAWATRGYTSGGRPGAWMTVGLPVGGDRLLTLGVDYSPLTWVSEPSLRGMLSIRQRLSFPMPFVRGIPIGASR
jgi:hypothetical protein